MNTVAISVRVDPEIKEEAEKVFRALGISTSTAVNIFFRQVAVRQGIPFRLELPPEERPDITKQTV